PAGRGGAGAVLRCVVFCGPSPKLYCSGIGSSLTPPAPPRRSGAGGLRRARVALLVYFGMFGLADGVWLARLPAVKDHLGLSDARLGVALLAAPVGLVVVAAFADRLIDRFGSART